MIEADSTFALLDALQRRADRKELETLFTDPDLALMFPALGIPTADGLEMFESFLEAQAGGSFGPDAPPIFEYATDLGTHRDSLERLLVDLKEAEVELTRAAFEETRRLLPIGADLGRPRIVVLPLGYDFRTDGDSLYMDPLAALSLGLDGIRKTWSHEFHHIARFRLTGRNLTLMRPDAGGSSLDMTEVVSDWAAWLEAEGIADCVSNMTQTDVPALREAAKVRSEQMADYQPLLTGALEGIHQNARVSRNSAAPFVELRSALRALAHPIGARMAGTILEVDGKSGLVDCVGKPKRFVTRYSDLASSRGLVGFDADVLRLIVPE
jgi:Putative zinc dependent peptidase (DUF5700)